MEIEKRTRGGTEILLDLKMNDESWSSCKDFIESIDSLE